MVLIEPLTCTVVAVSSETSRAVADVGTHSVHTHSLGVTGVVTRQTFIRIWQQQLQQSE